jgi:hypothetical protein
MDPVAMALQTIAAIESESRELNHPTETVQNLSASSRASSNGGNGPPALCANSKPTPEVNRASTAPSLAQLKAAPEALFAAVGEIKIDAQDHVFVAPARRLTRDVITIIAGALLLAMVLCSGWIAGFTSDLFTTKPASFPVHQFRPSADQSNAAKSNGLAMHGSSANITATNGAHETAKRSAQLPESLLTKQTTRSATTAVERANVSIKRSPVPETRPTTIDGWSIREVNGGTALLDGPSGVWKVARGDTVPGLGKIESIVRWGNRWIVATSRGLVSTR